MEEFLSICLGVGLAAACGFRVFVPMLIMSAAAMSGHLPLSPDLSWIGTRPAFICFLAATILEILGFYIPFIDNLLDSLAWPVSIIAGALVVAAVTTDVSPLLRWTMSIIAGGGTAFSVKTVAVAARGLSSAATGGTLNFVVATVEWLLAMFTAVLAIVLPLTAIVLLGITCYFALRWLPSSKRLAPAPGSQLAPEGKPHRASPL
jgi:Domain of unknown function (DUF4126)